MIPATINIIFAQGQIYFIIFAYLAVAMILENVFESELFSRWLARLSALVLILFVGLRWETGSDWLPYYRVFYTNDTASDFDSVIFGIDQGYIIFNRLMYIVSDNYTIFLLADAALAIGMVYRFIEKSTVKPNMGVFLFYSSYAITHFMGSNRRMLAIGLVCLALLHLRENEKLSSRWVRWAVPFGIAAFFHRTSIMALPGLVVGRRSWRPLPVMLGLSACAALGIAGVPFAGLEALGKFLSQYANITAINKLLFYTSGAESQSSAEFNVVAQAALGFAKRITVLAIFVPFMAWGKPTIYAQKLYNIYVLGCAIYFLLIGSPVFQVTSTYYTIVEIVLIPIILTQFPRMKVVYTLYLVATSLLLLLSALTPLMKYYVPYRSIFSWDDALLIR